MGHRPCAATVIACNMGMEVDSWVSIPKKQFSMYIRLCESASMGTNRRMAKEWKMAHHLTLSKDLKWADRFGPVRATVAYFHMAGWETSDAVK